MRNHVQKLVDAAHRSTEWTEKHQPMTPTERLAHEAIRLAQLASGVHAISTASPTCWQRRAATTNTQVSRP